MCSHNSLRKNIYRNFIHNGPDLETTKMSFNRQMDKQTGDCLYHEILFSSKKVYQAMERQVGNLNAQLNEEN